MGLIVHGLSEEQMLQRQSSVAGVLPMLDRIRPIRGRKSIKEYQAGWLYILTWKQFNYRGARVLEIGTAQGYSAAALALAMPMAEIITLNPNHDEAEMARKNLNSLGIKNVTVLEKYSWDYMADNCGMCDMIFVDGDHRQIARDGLWFNRLIDQGLMLFHDYSPADAATPCPPVYEYLESIKEWRGYGLDVEIVDDKKVGMAGCYRQYCEWWT